MPQQKISPLSFDRGKCTPKANPESLVLKDVEKKESVFFRVLGLLEGAELPNGYSGVDPSPHPWDLYTLLKYRQDWTPSGYGIGELLHTMSLLPNEEVVLELKTWETDKRLEEKDTTIEEKNLSDNRGTSSNSNEASNSLMVKERAYVDAKASYSGFGFSASVSAGWSKDTATANSNIAKQARTNTEQTTNELRSQRKVKIAHSREAGSESKTTRRIKNINQAYTLNINFFEVLREYEVTLNLTDVTLVLLGKPVSLNQHSVLYEASPMNNVVDYKLNGWKNNVGKLEIDTNINISWGNLLNGIRNNDWVAQFIEIHGFSPILALFRAWSKSLYDGGLSRSNPAPTPEQKTAFQQKMLKYVRPTPGWVEPDETGQIRWAFEIVPGFEEEALSYLYQFVPFQFAQIVFTLINAGQNKNDAISNANLFYLGRGFSELNKMPEKILIPGTFQNIDLVNFETNELPKWVTNIIKHFQNTLNLIGAIKVNGSAIQKVALPTNGVHADLSLGLCSGAEDYYEIQRHFDLELKKLEIEKLKLEVEKLKIENQAFLKGKPNIQINNPTEKTAVNLNISPSSDSSLQVDIEGKKQ